MAMKKPQFVGGPLDGGFHLRGDSQWTGLVVPANPERHHAHGVNVLYRWGGVNWVFMRYVERGEDVGALCYPRKPRGICLRDER